MTGTAKETQTIPMPASRMRIVAASAVLVMASAAMVASARRTLNFDSTPGEQHSAPLKWPAAASRAHRLAGTSTLLIFAHPYCSCTSATFSELEVILASEARKPATRVFFAPLEDGGISKIGESWEQARRLPGAEVSWDLGNREALLFGARTSGFAVLYDPSGNLLFQGGVTGSRGHEGRNKGAQRLADALRTLRPEHNGSFVFGCSLLGSEINSERQGR